MPDDGGDERDHATWCARLEGVRLPAAIVVLDAFDHNLDVMLERLRAHGLPLRLATKSLRVPALIARVRERAKRELRGLMCFSAEEADYLAGEGFDHLLVAYPTLQARALRALARRARDGREVCIAVDSEESARAASEAAAAEGATLDVVFCTDMSWEPVGPRAHVGVLRSPLRTPEQVVALARTVSGLGHARARGVIAYEAQVAGLGDRNPFSPALGPIVRLVRRRSMADVAKRRVALVAALVREGADVSIVNGGGTGSLDLSTSETGVNEVAAGSGLFKPHLYDYYSDPWMQRLRPALFVALEAVRRPTSRHVTCAGGGYVASGSAGADKHPLPWSPAGAVLTGPEMTGEVQTPVVLPPGVHVALGAPVVFRPAKAGEPLERFAEVVLVQKGRVVGRAHTYRGLGQTY